MAENPDMKKSTFSTAPRYLTARQVADRYGQRLSWVYGCRTLPRRKVGKYLVFREDELEEFEKSWQRATPSYRTFATKKEMGVTTSYKNEECWLAGHPPERNKFKLLFDLE